MSDLVFEDFEHLAKRHIKAAANDATALAMMLERVYKDGMRAQREKTRKWLGVDVALPTGSAAKP